MSSSLTYKLSLLGLTLLWAFLAYCGHPFPHPDDCPLAGAALNIAQGGGLMNLLTEPHQPFYSYPPVYVYCLGFWLRIFGISSIAVAGYSFVLSWLTTWNVLEIYLARGRALTGWFVVGLLVAFIAAMGMRSDLTGLFFLSISLRLGFSEKRGAQLLAPFFAMLATATHPAFLAISIPWLLWMFVRQHDAKAWAANILGALGVLAILTIMVHGALIPFFHTFLSHGQSAREQTTAFVLSDFWQLQNCVKMGFLPALCLVLVVIKCIKSGVGRNDWITVLALLLSVYTMFTTITGQRVICLVALVGICYYAELLFTPVWVARSLSSLVALLAIASLGRPLLQGICSDKPVALGKQLRAQVAQLQPGRIVIDQWSLRYVFDFNPGSNAVFLCSRNRGNGNTDRFKVDADECWVVSAEAAYYFSLPDSRLPKPEKMRLMGRQLGQWLKNPGEMNVVGPGQTE